MFQTTLNDLRDFARQARGAIDKIYLHWTAGHYGQLYLEEYHIAIDADGKIYLGNTDLTRHLSHTYMRNTGAIGITLACCAEATTNGLGPEPPTEAQIESMAQVVAVLCEELGLEISINTVLTHGEAGDNKDGVFPPYENNGYPYGMYGPENSCERWDLWFLKDGDAPGTGGDILRGKAIWYQQNGC